MSLIVKIASPSSVRHSERYRCRVDPIYRFAADWSTSLFTSVTQSLSRNVSEIHTYRRRTEIE